MARNQEQVNPIDIPSWKITLGYVIYFSCYLCIFGVVWYFWRDLMLISTDTIFSTVVPITTALLSVWWLFDLWPFVAATGSYGIHKILGIQDNTPPTRLQPGLIFLKGIYISINAGFFEELIYRWLGFLVAMPTAVCLNWITFGLYKWLMITVLIPLANWTTLGSLSPQLTGSEWTIGAAIIMSNASFRDGHKGLFARINSWFLGMVMFWLMFNYGIWSAIAAHILYDCIVFAIIATFTAVKRHQDTLDYRYYHSFY